VAGDNGHAQCVALFRGGLIRDGAWRKVLIDALLGIGETGDSVFYHLMVDAGADDAILCEVALDHLNAFAAWLNMPAEYRDAFRTRLVARPNLLTRLLDHLPTSR